MKKSCVLLLSVIALLLSLSACRTVGASGSDTKAPEQTSAPPTFQDPLDTIRQEKTVLFTQLWRRGSTIVLVSPLDNRLTSLDLTTGQSAAICDLPADREFLILENRVFFRNRDTGELCAVNMDGTELTTYYRMPFGSGAMKNGVLYFLGDPESVSGETLLYSYDPLNGVWSTTLLNGCALSPTRQTAVFLNDALYYIASDFGVERIIRQTIGTGERTVLYTVGRTGSGYLTELHVSHGTLYFHDRASNSTYSWIANGELLDRIEMAGDRLYAVLTEGLLFGSTEAGGEKLFFGNLIGHSAEYRSGVVMTTGGSRALVRRNGDNGEDQLAIVKYPEDEDQALLLGSLMDYRTDGAGNAVVFFHDSDTCTYVNLMSGQTQTVSVSPVALKVCPVEQYLLQPGTQLSADALQTATPQQLAQAFATAVARNDWHTLGVLLPDGLHAYPTVRMKSWSVSRNEQTSTETSETYRIVYTPYAEADAWCLSYAPGILRSGSLTLVRDEAGWHLVQPEDNR